MTTSEIDSSPKVLATHRYRSAVVYVRQSTPGQVEHNTESTDRGELNVECPERGPPRLCRADPRGRTTLTSTSGGRHLPVARGEETADTCLSVGDPADVAVIENAYGVCGVWSAR
jgi:hypothetical protein